ncbi:MAG: wax ester/triacylglycerol synthase family O-acyltransferase, partial [Actinomycetota bacterium]|nr:wax ester/triacylglycerol synthase family O-acyltransferase [Actinomycetota bacterium]
MPDRLSALDVSFLYLEEPSTPMHVGGVAIFAPPEEGLDYERLVSLIEGRIGLVPRYRQKVRWVPGRLASPVWVDDPDFDVAFHVRRSALPRPGSQQQLQDLVGRVQARQLDRSRPLWEMYLVEGLEDGRIAVITKTHHAMVDGISAVDIGQVILDTTREPRATPADDWRPRRPPGPVGLLAGAWLDFVRRPQVGLENLRGELVDVRATGTKLLG